MALKACDCAVFKCTHMVHREGQCTGLDYLVSGHLDTFGDCLFSHTITSTGFASPLSDEQVSFN